MTIFAAYILEQNLSRAREAGYELSMSEVSLAQKYEKLKYISQLKLESTDISTEQKWKLEAYDLQHDAEVIKERKRISDKRLRDRVGYNQPIFYFGIIFGIIMTIGGFILWYVKVQRHLDKKNSRE